MRLTDQLSTALAVPIWHLEHVCEFLYQSPAPPLVARSDLDLEADETVQKKRVWLISPGKRACYFDEFYAAGMVAIGWDFLGDLRQYASLDEVRAAICVQQGEEVAPTNDANACFQFAQEMQVGDVVLAKRGSRELVGYGLVSAEYCHDSSRSYFQNVRSVEWKKRGSCKHPPPLDYVLGGHRILVRTLDLGAPWRTLHDQLLGLVEQLKPGP